MSVVEANNGARALSPQTAVLTEALNTTRKELSVQRDQMVARARQMEVELKVLHRDIESIDAMLSSGCEPPSTRVPVMGRGGGVGEVAPPSHSDDLSDLG